MELEITGKRKNVNQGNCGKSANRGICHDMAWEERMHMIKRKLKQTFPTLISRSNGVKADNVVVVNSLLNSGLKNLFSLFENFNTK